MHLIKRTIAGRELPSELPASLVPPSLRPAQAPVAGAGGGQQQQR